MAEAFRGPWATGHTCPRSHVVMPRDLVTGHGPLCPCPCGPHRLGQAGGGSCSCAVQGHFSGWLVSCPRVCVLWVAGTLPHTPGQPPRLLSHFPLRFCLRSIWSGLFIGRNVGMQMHLPCNEPAPRPHFPFRSLRVPRPVQGQLAPWSAPRGPWLVACVAVTVCLHAGAASLVSCSFRNRQPCSRAFILPP